MATIYAAPEPAPDMDAYKTPDGHFDWQAWDKATEEYIPRMQQWARDNGQGDLAGELYYVPRGDGKAVYVVFTHRPFALIHLEVWDNWSASPAEERGLRLSDVKAQLEFEKRWKELGEKQAAERAAAQT